MKFDLTTPAEKAYANEYIPTPDPATAEYAEIKGWWKPPNQSELVVFIAWLASDDSPITGETVTLDGADFIGMFRGAIPFEWVQHDQGSNTATSGTATSVTDSGESYTPDALIGKRITVTGGTNAGESAIVTDNDATSITFDPAMPVACDNTTVFTVRARIYPLIEQALLEAAMAKLGVAGAIV